jgi:hypothetical protein
MTALVAIGPLVDLQIIRVTAGAHFDFAKRRPNILFWRKKIGQNFQP